MWITLTAEVGLGDYNLVGKLSEPKGENEASSIHSGARSGEVKHRLIDSNYDHSHLGIV